ncbi:MAG TPA: alcohol dehydrogenase catalytic domain-containing protein [Jiangellaceae bacterium]|jgi:alcohol dehydrogenase/L-iditol 2-dehydrogenase
MRAIILPAPGRVELVNDQPEPEPGPHDVVVAIRAVGLCGSDLSVFDGTRSTPWLPWVMGHEGGGDIVAIGDEVHDREVGQRVVIEPNYPCLTCPQCRLGHTSACAQRGIVGINVPGLLAERVAVPARFTWPVDSAAPSELLACVEPLVVARSAVQSSGVAAGDRCLVVGAGSQGLLVCLSLLAIGAQPEIIDPHQGRAKLAVDLGAKHAKDGNDYPFVFETAGAPAAVREALDRAARLGKVVLIGLHPADLPLSILELVRRQLTLQGKLIYDHPQDFADTLSALDHGFLPIRVIGARFVPDDAATAFSQARTVVGKTWIDLSPWQSRMTA